MYINGKLMMRRTKEEAAITRENLLAAALVVFSRSSYSTTTLDDVAKEAGVTRGAIYWHFHSKAELYAALLEKYSSRGGQIVQQAASEGGSLVEILRRVFLNLLSAIEMDKDLRAVMEINLFKTEQTAELEANHQRQMVESKTLLNAIAEAMRQGINAGDLRNDISAIEMARAFLAFQNGIVYNWLWDQSAFSLSASASALAAIFLGGIIQK
jgi:TetR/AcrR family transcriptional regulator, acrAB operon repressor